MSASPHRPDATTRSLDVLRRRDGTSSSCRDCVATEVPVALAFNGRPFAVMMATPADLHEFALGFCLSEAIVDGIGEVRIDAIEERLEGFVVSATLPDARIAALGERRRALEGRSGCGICGSTSLEAVLRTPRTVPGGVAVAGAAIARALEALPSRQPLAAATGATHAAAWADPEGRLCLVREDVGRHNALDKLIGAMAREGRAFDAGFALVTSRASYEMVMKSAQAGIPMLVAISAPTALAVSLARGAGMTLVGFARDEGHVAYAHAHRLAGMD